ncbi:MAG: hypothetical protein DRJ45_06180, partial [Thermoprotei archaeon]
MYVSCRDAIIRSIGFDLVGGLSWLGIDSFEMKLDRNYRNAFEYNLKKDLEEFRKILSENDFTVNCILLANDLGKDLSLEVKYVLDAIDIASRLDVRVLRINAIMKEIEGYTLDKYVKRTLEFIDIVKNRLRETNMCLAVENHGVISNNFDYLKRVLDATDPEIFGVTLDTGNFYWYGYPINTVHKIIEEIADRVKHTHMKNAVAKNGRKNVKRNVGEIVMAPLD